MKEGWQSFVIAMLITCGIIAGLLFFNPNLTNPKGFTLSRFIFNINALKTLYRNCAYNISVFDNRLHNLR